MSTSGPPTPDEIVEATGVGPDEARAIASAMQPLQDITGIGSSIGSAASQTDAAGMRFVGTALEALSQQVSLASTSAESLARAMEFYVEAQTASFEELFPPPAKLAEQVSDDAMPLVQAIDRLADRGGPGNF